PGPQLEGPQLVNIANPAAAAPTRAVEKRITISPFDARLREHSADAMLLEPALIPDVTARVEVACGLAGAGGRLHARAKGQRDIRRRGAHRVRDGLVERRTVGVLRRARVRRRGVPALPRRADDSGAAALLLDARDPHADPGG